MKTLCRPQIVYFLIFAATLMGGIHNASAQGRGGSGRSAKPISYSSGRSGTLFDIGIYYGQSQATADPAVGNEWNSSVSVYDFKLGYVMEEGYFVGAMYSAYTQSAAATVGNPALDSVSGSGAGLGLGYFWENGFYVRAYYRLNDSFGDYKNGSGYQADLGYSVNLTSNFFLGLMFSNRQLTYQDNSTIPSFDYWTKKETYPFVTLGFMID